MPSSSDTPNTDKLYWLTQPRYAAVTWPPFLAGFGFIAGHWSVALTLLAVMVCGGLRLTKLKLLPHEIKRLAQAKAAIHSAQPARAADILQTHLSFTGTHYQLRRAILLSDTYCQQGKFLEAHTALAGFKAQHLQKDEELLLQVAWARLYLEADNPAAARRRLGDIAEQKCTADFDCLLIRAELELLAENFIQARNLLESGLDRYKDPSERMLLHNNLARLELVQNRTAAQLRHLQAARFEFNRQPSADLTNIIHHNLAIALVRNGQPEEAKAVLAEALAQVQRDNLQQVLDLLNNQLLAAREAGDAKWIKAVYTEFERQLERLKPKTEQEQLALDISELRMRRNDAVAHKKQDYSVRLERVLDKLKNASPAVPIIDRLHGLTALRADLQYEIQNQLQQSGQPPKQLLKLNERASRQLLGHDTTIDTWLSSLSPLLIAPLLACHRLRTDADKARIQLAENPEQLQAAFATLFKHLREKAEWQAEQGTTEQAIEAWLILCDEVVAYHDQLPPELQQSWQRQHNLLAQHSLDQATTLMDKLKNKRLQIDKMIGLAYFHLRLRSDKKTAAYWIDIVHSYQPSLHQYAVWLREYYVYVCGELGDGVRAFK